MRDALPEPGGRSPLTLVIGVGNDWRRDDAAGLEVARRVPGAVSVREPSQLLDAWAGERDVVIVDAVAVAAGDAPGSIHRVDAIAEPLSAELFPASTHHVGIAEVVELGRTLGRLPERLTVYGVAGVDFAAGAGLTPAVERAVERLAGELRARSGTSPEARPAPTRSNARAARRRA